MQEALIISKKLTFSGHDTFHCRHLWLKKGYEFVKKGNKFSNEDAVLELGVGKNMVSGINYKFLLGVPHLFCSTQSQHTKANTSGYPLQSFIRSSQKDFRFFP